MAVTEMLAKQTRKPSTFRERNTSVFWVPDTVFRN